MPHLRPPVAGCLQAASGPLLPLVQADSLSVPGLPTPLTFHTTRLSPACDSLFQTFLFLPLFSLFLRFSRFHFIANIDTLFILLKKFFFGVIVGSTLFVFNQSVSSNDVARGPFTGSSQSFPIPATILRLPSAGALNAVGFSRFCCRHAVLSQSKKPTKQKYPHENQSISHFRCPAPICCIQTAVHQPVLLPHVSGSLQWGWGGAPKSALPSTALGLSQSPAYSFLSLSDASSLPLAQY